MDERSTQNAIKAHLQREDAQERIVRYIQKGRAEATVTISRAAELFEFTENKLRDWEKYGFLTPLRPIGPMGRRLYTQSELDKLAIIRELIDAGYAPSDIPRDIDKIWRSLHADEWLSSPERRIPFSLQSDRSYDLPINRRIEQARADLFWRYYTSHALRLSLLLICEDIPGSTAGLLLSLSPQVDISSIYRVEDLTKLGETLVGWLDQGQSSYTLLASHPFFQYSTDYRIQALRAMKAGVPQEDGLEDRTLVVVPRETRPLTLNSYVVETIQRLLRPLYRHVAVRACFAVGTRDILLPATDLDSGAKHEDTILNGLAEVVVALGGETADGLPRWRFCCILLPNYPVSTLSIQQRSLVVRAQSKYSPHQVGVTTLSSQTAPMAPCISAFQGGHIIYLPSISPVDSTIAFRHLEEPLRSAVAVPIEGHDGVPIAVIYVVSEYPQAFPENDQRLLRMIGKMVSERLTIYQVRLLSGSKLSNAITAPAVVDPLFREFLSENEFIRDVEDLLIDVQLSASDQLEKMISFIAIDIDSQSSFANKYGDRVARDLSSAVGFRIRSQLRTFKDDAEYELYHVSADRFYIALKGLSLDRARIKAELLRQVLCGSYQVDPLRAPAGQPALPENMITFSHVTVRLGVTSYFYWKLQEVLQRFPAETAVVEVRIQILNFLDEALVLGRRAGGNIVMSWEPELRGFIPWPPSHKL